tara:strand:+ start:1150 stop:2055 length:906 start_codon:yes stop_codon:yes gene_type:complete
MARTIIPPFLDPGSGIAIIAPSRYADPSIIQLAKNWIKENGWIPYAAPNLGTKKNQFGGTDQQRADDFNWAISNPKVQAIWSIRGGYGAVRMVDYINWGDFKRNPKWIIGFSDFTVLLCHILKENIMGIHSWMPIQMPLLNNKSLTSLSKALEGNADELKSKKHPKNVKGKTLGELKGGNLSVLYSLLGSDSFPKLDGCILALEDLDEYKYHIDRIIIALKRAKVLEKIIGIAIGSFSEIKDNVENFGQEPFDIIKENFPKDIPLAIGLPFGHESDNEAFITGKNYELEVNDSGSRLTPIH